MTFIEQVQVERALMTAFSHVMPDEIEVVWTDDWFATQTGKAREVTEHLLARQAKWYSNGFFVRSRDGEFDGRGVTANFLEPFDSGELLDLDSDLRSFEAGIIEMLDQTADAITEILRTPWPHRTFPILRQG
jgi:hypothetical protein